MFGEVEYFLVDIGEVSERFLSLLLARYLTTIL